MIILKSSLRKCLHGNFGSNFFNLFVRRNLSSERELSILFYGSDDFSLASLRLLRKKFKKNEAKQRTSIKRLEVVTNSDCNLISLYCKKVNLECHQFNTYTVPANQFDLGVVSSFGRLIPSHSIQSCHYGMLNIHASLLPRWRGASPIQHTILANDPVSGLTIMRIQPKKFDVGMIVAQRKVNILHRITATDLKQLLAPLGANLLWECIDNLDQSLTNARAQSEDGVTYAPKILISDGEINWNTMDSRHVDRRYRALSGSVDIHTYWIDGTILKLNDCVDPDLVHRFNLPLLTSAQVAYHIPGMLYYHKKRHLLCIACADGTWIAFRSFTLKRRKRMSALGFYNTFIRPVSKEFRKQHSGLKPIFVVGSPGYNTAVPGGLYSPFDLERIWVQAQSSAL